MSISIAKAKKNAVELTEDCISRECMFTITSMPETHEHNWEKGDPENFSTIASTAIDEGVDGVDFHDGIDAIVEYLSEQFPDYV